MDENIQPTESLTGFVEEVAQVVQVAHVCPHQQGKPAQFPDLGRGFLSGDPVAEEIDGHVRTVAGQVEGDGAPDAAP